jgi:hypothetical protein
MSLDPGEDLALDGNGGASVHARDGATGDARDGAGDAAAASARIERLLDELRTMVAPLAWQRVDELVTTIVDVYGRALAQLAAAVAPERRRALADEEPAATVLALHGLHPLPPDERIRRALEQLAPQLGRVELVSLADGAARVRALDAPAIAGAATAIERLLQEAAPELQRIEIDGLREPATHGTLVQIDLLRSRARTGE